MTKNSLEEASSKTIIIISKLIQSPSLNLSPPYRVFHYAELNLVAAVRGIHYTSMHLYHAHLIGFPALRRS